jgi:hypothetical protein
MFLARRSDLRLVKTPKYPQFGQGGQKVGESRGEVLAFRDGRLDVPATGTMRLEDGTEIDAVEALEWLNRHPMLGSTEEGFWQIDQMAPPVSEEEINTLVEKSFDEDALREIIRQEETGWQRPALLNPAHKAMERLMEVHAAMAAEQEQQAAEAKKAAK